MYFESISKPETIRSSRDFQTVYRKGISRSDSFFKVFLLRREDSIVRLGLTVSKKLGKAVVRNRIKRLLRASFRDLYPSIKSGGDIVIIARKGMIGSKKDEVYRRMSVLLKKMNILYDNGKK